MSHPRPGIGLELGNTQIDKSAGNSGRKGPRTLRGLASLALPIPALQIPASGRPIGRPLQTERVTPPLGYVSGQCPSNSPDMKSLNRGERLRSHDGGYNQRVTDGTPPTRRPAAD